MATTGMQEVRGTHVKLARADYLLLAGLAGTRDKKAVEKIDKRSERLVDDDEKGYRQYVEESKWLEFEKVCEMNSMDFYGCGCILTAHLVMEKLMAHIGESVLKEKKCTPKEAWEEAMVSDPGHSGASAAMTANLISTYSPRGKEFKKFWKKENQC